jgi:hypothetical protein
LHRKVKENSEENRTLNELLEKMVQKQPLSSREHLYKSKYEAAVKKIAKLESCDDQNIQNQVDFYYENEDKMSKLRNQIHFLNQKLKGNFLIFYYDLRE